MPSPHVLQLYLKLGVQFQLLCWILYYGAYAFVHSAFLFELDCIENI